MQLFQSFVFFLLLARETAVKHNGMIENLLLKVDDCSMCASAVSDCSEKLRKIDMHLPRESQMIV